MGYYNVCYNSAQVYMGNVNMFELSEDTVGASELDTRTKKPLDIDIRCKIWTCEINKNTMPIMDI